MSAATQYAKVVWTPSDVQSIAPAWTLKQCEEWLSREQRHIQDRLIELGWDVLETLIPIEAKKGGDADDEESDEGATEGV